MADARRAGLVKPNSAWEKFPQDLLYYRALMSAARKFAPEALGGIGYTPEELSSISNGGATSQAPLEAAEESAEGIKPSPSTNPLVRVAKERGAVVIPEFPKLNKKYGVSLDFCWLHDNTDWKPNKFGKRNHKTDDGWCKFNEAIKPVVAEIAKSQGWDAGTMTDILKEKYEGRTWSKLSEEEQCLFLDNLITE